MIELNSLGKYRKGRLWKSNIPQSKIMIKRGSKKINISGKVCKLEEMSIALELYYPRNVSNYGMLGIRIIPDDSKEILINIYETSDNNIKFENSLVAEYDEVYLGIESEYCDIILETAEKYIIQKKLRFSGVVEFAYGAWSEVGSSQNVFAKLTELLMGIIWLGTTDIKIIEQFVSENM